MNAKLSPTKARKLIDSLITERCSNIQPSDILTPGAFSRPEHAIWSPEQIVMEILHLTEGTLDGQLLDHHKYQVERIQSKISIFDSCTSDQSELDGIPEQRLPVTTGYLSKIYAEFNRLNWQRRPTASGFCQARSNLSYQVCKDISLSFINRIFNNQTLSELDTLIFAIDGSNVPISVNFEEPQNIVCTGGKPRAGLHLNAACCLNTGNLLVDVMIQNETKKDEHAAAFKIIKDLRSRFPDKRLIFIMDRLYFSYKLAKFCESESIDVVIRLKSKVFSNLAGGAPVNQMLDKSCNVTCTSAQNKEVRDSEQFRHVPLKTIEAIKEALELPEDENLTLKYRVVSTPMPNEVKKALSSSQDTNKDDLKGYTYLYTTLSEEELSADSLVILYFWRWQIEVSYGNLKYKTGMNALHSRKENNILQEIWISIMKYNATCAIISDQEAKILKRERRFKKKGKRETNISDPRKDSQKTQVVRINGEEPEYKRKLSFAETARNLRKFLLGQITEKEFHDELHFTVVYTLEGRHTPRGSTSTRVHGTHWSFH